MMAKIKLKSLLLFTAAVFAPFAASADSVFVPGTWAGDTRYDVKKVEYGAEGSPDRLMCWAASASNNLQLWQDNLAAAGYPIPSGVPNGKTQDTYSLDIFNVFANNWEDKSGVSALAYQWYFTGSYDIGYAGGFEVALPLEGASEGGYWKELGLDVDDICVRLECQAGTVLHPVEGAKDLLKNSLNEVLENGWLASLSVNNYSNHSVTLAGYEFDAATGDITGLWICDSDNPNTSFNFLLDIYWSDGYQAWVFGEAHIDNIVSDYDNLEGWMIVSMDVLKVPFAIPEPSSFAALFGVLALALAMRRYYCCHEAVYRK